MKPGKARQASLKAPERHGAGPSPSDGDAAERAIAPPRTDARAAKTARGQQHHVLTFRDPQVARKRLAEILQQRRRRRQEERRATTLRRSTGNVFADLGFEPEEAEHLLLRAELMIAPSKALEVLGLTQVQAAKLLGVSQRQ